MELGKRKERKKQPRQRKVLATQLITYFYLFIPFRKIFGNILIMWWMIMVKMCENKFNILLR